MKSAVRTLVAAAALALAGFAGSAAAAPAHPGHGLLQLKVKWCFPHYETKVRYLRIYPGVKLILVYWVDKHCHRHLVRVIRVPLHRFG
jgi:hypothetical protein